MSDGPSLDLTREQILEHRRTVGALDARLPAGEESLRRAVHAGLQDSMPRAAVLSIHARLEATQPDAWADPAFVQVWGPRYSAYVIAGVDRAVFTLGRLPDAGAERRRAESTADALARFLAGRTMTYGEAGRGLGVEPNSLRYATTTGRVLIRWEGARQPTIWTVPPPPIEPRDARLELARRNLHVFGPSTPEAFGRWAGIRPSRAGPTFDELASSLTRVRTPLGDAWILTADEPSFRAPPTRPPAVARLLPSGDTYFLLWGADRELLVPDARRRGELWTTRVWPGAVVVDGEVAGTWRRAGPEVAIEPWRAFSPAAREAVESEAASLPLPAVAGQIRVRWLT
jgi:hypothetical protein